jgi:hypothetical protein
MHILSSQCHSTTWYIAFSISPSRILGRSEGKNTDAGYVEKMKHRFIVFTQVVLVLDYEF